MKKNNSYSELLMEELANLLNAGNQLVEALSKMAQASQSSVLKAVLEVHRGVVRNQINRLQDISHNITQHPHEITCQEMKGFISESEDVMSSMEMDRTRDAAIINVVQKAVHYEIARYKIAREYAADLGHTDIIPLFTTTLNEKRDMNLHLNELAQGVINVQTMDPMGSGRKVNKQKKNFLLFFSLLC